LKIRIKLSSVLEHRKMSQRELSRLTGIRLASISEMCNNTTQRLTLSNLASICDVMQCEISDVIALEE
jgi:putative transcriptional regulator